MTVPSVPEEFSPVYKDALDYYPQLGGDKGRFYPPFGYHTTDGGSWACDGRRLHVDGELPDEYWTQVLDLEINEYGVISIWSTDCFRPAAGDSELPELPALVSLDRLDRGTFIHEKSYPENESPEGFLVRRSYLLEALEFLFGDRDRETQLEFAVCYNQGVFELFEWDDKTIAEGLPRRRCYIAGYLGSQWLLPMNEWLVRLEKGPQLPSARAQASLVYGSQLEEKVSMTYPFPLAYSYRLSMDSTSAIEESIQLLRTGENLLAFLGSLLLALTPALDRRHLGLDPTILWQKGITPGGWLDIVRRTADNLAGSDELLASTLAGSVLAPDRKGGVKGALQYLARRKNDLKHDRAFGSEEAAHRENPALRDSIDQAYEALEFLAQHPLRLVYSLDFSSEEAAFLLDCFRYQGAYPHLRREGVPWYEALPKGRLYLEVSPMTWAPMYPFLHRDYCPKCDATELFFLDKLPGKGKAIMKSFERGHTADVPEVASAVETWFAS